MQKTVGILLIILAIIMLYLGFTLEAWPPAITGIGFVAIALVFLSPIKR
jgi:small-conductance mechanosensitive channel